MGPASLAASAAPAVPCVFTWPSPGFLGPSPRPGGWPIWEAEACGCCESVCSVCPAADCCGGCSVCRWPTCCFASCCRFCWPSAGGCCAACSGCWLFCVASGCWPLCFGACWPTCWIGCGTAWSAGCCCCCGCGTGLWPSCCCLCCPVCSMCCCGVCPGGCCWPWPGSSQPPRTSLWTTGSCSGPQCPWGLGASCGQGCKNKEHVWANKE